MLYKYSLKYMQDSTDGIIASAGGIRKLLVYQFSSKVVKQEDMADDVSGKVYMLLLVVKPALFRVGSIIRPLKQGLDLNFF